MSRKIRGALIGAMIGACLLGACTQVINSRWTIISIIAGIIIGSGLGFMFVVGQAQMIKDRETGLDG